MSTYGASTVTTATPRRAFRNIAAQVISFSAGVPYTLAPGDLVSIAKPLADASSDLAGLLASGTLLELTVYGGTTMFPEVLGAPGPTPVGARAGTLSFTAATQSYILGSFAGITIDAATGHGMLADGNRLIYPNSRLRSQPAAGPSSAVTIGAVFSRPAIAGSFGFALYTDAQPTDATFANGFVVLYESTGVANIYQITAGQWNNIVDRSFAQQPYPLDELEHTYAAVVQQPDSSSIKITVFCDSTPLSTATLTNGKFSTNGTIGFATASGSPPILIGPDSFEFELGVDLRERMPTSVQQIIQTDSTGHPVLNLAPTGGALGTVLQLNLDPAVVEGSVTGTGKNLVPDSDLKFAGAIWNTFQAGSLATQNGVGLTGGKGILFTQPTGVNAAISQMRYVSASFSVLPGNVYSFSGNIQNLGGIAGGAGLPAWELWSLNVDGSLNTRLQLAAQALGVGTATDGKARVKVENVTIPIGVNAVAQVAATNGVALAGGFSLIFSEPQCESGPYATAYVSNLLDDNNTIVPFSAMDTPITTAIVISASGTGLLNVGSPAPGQQLPLGASSSEIQSTIGTVSNGNSFLQPQSVGNSAVAPASIAAGQAAPVTYDDATANVFNNQSANFNWYVPGIGPVTAANTIVDGASIVYSVNSVDPAAVPVPALEQLTLAANATATIVFTHPSFTASAQGTQTRICFAGSQVGTVTELLLNAAFSDLSSPSITALTNQSNSTPVFTKAFADTGNPFISSTQQTVTTQQRATRTISDSETVSISSSSSSSTTNQQFTGAVPLQTQTPAITSQVATTTGATPKTQIESNTSTPTITSRTAPQNVPVAQSSSGSISSAPQIVPTFNPPAGNSQKSSAPSSVSSSASVTQNASTTYSNQQKSSTPANVGSSTQILKTANPTTFSTNQHTATAAGSTSTATQTQAATQLAGQMGPAGSSTITNQHWYTSTRTYVGSDYTGGGSTSTTIAGALPPTAAHPMSITPTLTGGTDGTWFVTLQRPDGSTYKTWTPSTGVAITVADNAETQSGSWKWFLGITRNPDNDNGNGTTSITTSSTSSWSSTYSYYQNSVIANAGSWVTISTLPSIVAPTSAATQIAYTVASETLPSNANGVSSVNVRLRAPNGTIVASVTGITTGGSLTYSTSAAAGGSGYLLQYQTVCTSTNQSVSSYTATVSGTASWYQSDANPTTYTFSTVPGVVNQLLTTAQTLAVSSATPLSLVISSLVCPADANGSTALAVTLTDPNGAVLYNKNITTNQTILYNTAGAPAGQYTWSLEAVIANDAQVNAATYSVTCTAQDSWYESVATTVYTYTSTIGAATSLTTSSATLAPSAGTPLTLVLTNVAAPADSAGTSAFTVELSDPVGALVQRWTGITTSQTLTRNSANGSAGTSNGQYTWKIYGVPTANDTAGATYVDTLNAQPQWYEVNTVGTYTYTTPAGSSSTYSIGVGALAPVDASTQLALSFSNVIVPADSNGASTFAVSLTDPNSVVVQTWTVATNTTLTYSKPGAVAGVYTWTVQGQIATNAQTATSTVTYTDTAQLALGWYTSQSVNTTTYTSNTGSSTIYGTGAATLAPVDPASQLTLTINALTTGSNAQGSSFYNVVLQSPSGVTLTQWQNITATRTLVYSNAAAGAGSYKWIVSAGCTNTGTGTSSYSDSMNFTLGWYENVTTSTTTYSTTPGTAATFTTALTASAPTSLATQLSFAIATLVAPSDVNGACTWAVTLTDPNAVIVKTWTGITTPQTLAWFGAFANAGQYTWTLQAACTSNATATETYTAQIAGTLKWYQSVTTSASGYTGNPGTPASFQTPASALAPRSSATQLSLNINSISTPSTAAGTCSYVVTLQDSGSNLVGSWTSVVGPGPLAPLTYWNASALSGVYTWTIYATVTLSNAPSASNFTCSLIGTIGWFVAGNGTITVYQGNASSSVTSVQTDPATLAPTSTATQLTFAPGSIVVPVDVNGVCAYTVTLKSPGGSILQTWQVTGLAPLTYVNAAAVPGIYTWTMQAVCSTNSNATEQYATSMTGTIGWTQAIAANTLICTNHDGAAAHYATPANTAAPTSTATALQLILNSVTAPSYTQGASSVTVMLFDPNNVLINTVTHTGITAPTSITYTDAAAIAGAYTWVVFGQCSNTASGAQSFGVAWNGFHSWYQPQNNGSQVYVLAADGITQRLSCADANVLFQVNSQSTVQFQVTNSANTALTFKLGIVRSGF